MMSAVFFLTACSGGGSTKPETPDQKDTVAQEEEAGDGFKYLADQFADVKVIRYQIPGWDELPLRQKKLSYYLLQAGLVGRDIMYDQNYRHNLTIRRALEKIYREYSGDKTVDDWKNFEVYLKRIWFSNGIHHHYAYDKFEPEFSREYLETLLAETGQELSEEVMEAIFNPEVDAKKVSKDADKDLVLNSAVNFYAPTITEKEVEEFYKKMSAKGDKQRPLSYGINSKLVKENGQLKEHIWKVGGMYGAALEKSVSWLEKAKGVAENPQQANAIGLLIKYYQTGELQYWDDFNIAWAQDTLSDIDFIHGFVEVYNDPLSYRGSWETIIQVRDMDATSKMKVLAENAQYFETNSPIMDEHKKEKVVGISYNFINVVGEAGDASPSTPIGVNLPNANWIRAEFGSKSVSLGNIVQAYDKAGTKGFSKEFSHDEEEIALGKKYGRQADKLHTALHEVIGHASGKLEKDVGTPKETLKNYSSTLEEGRADLVALYYLLDPKLIEMGIMESLDVGKNAYDDYIKNGMLLQLRRLKPGDVIEEDHMRNRQLIAKWVYEKGKDENVIEMVKRDGNTYFEIHDYDRLRELFGDLLREIQRIKSQGDYDAAKALVEGYGVQVDADLHKEVLARAEKFKSAPYGGFVNPWLVPVEENGEITDIKVEYPESFAEQMLKYADEYTVLPDYN